MCRSRCKILDEPDEDEGSNRVFGKVTQVTPWISDAKVEAGLHAFQDSQRITINAHNGESSVLQRSDDAPLSARQNDRRTLVHHGCDRLAHGTRRLRRRVDQSVDIAEPKCAFDLSQSVVEPTEQPDQHIGQGIQLVGTYRRYQ